MIVSSQVEGTDFFRHAGKKTPGILVLEPAHEKTAIGCLDHAHASEPPQRLDGCVSR